MNRRHLMPIAMLVLTAGCAADEVVTVTEAPSANTTEAETRLVELALFDADGRTPLADVEVCLMWGLTCFLSDADGIVLLEAPTEFAVAEVRATTDHPAHLMSLPEDIADVMIDMPIMSYHRIDAISAATDTSWEGRSVVLATTFDGSVDGPSADAEIDLHATDEDGPFYVDDNWNLLPEAEATDESGQAVFLSDPHDADLPNLATGAGILSASQYGEPCYGAWSAFERMQVVTLRPETVTVARPMACLEGAR